MFTANFSHNDVWIVDSGASDPHDREEIFIGGLQPIQGKLNCKDSRWIISKVEGVGSVYLTDKLVLKTVPYVPKLACNLLLVSKLVKDLNCIAKFTSNLCEFQILDSEKMIDSARLSSELYQLKVNGSPARQTHKAARYQFKVMYLIRRVKLCCHYRLGYPNLQKLFPSLFINKNPKLFQCEVCQFSKHSRTPYHIQPYKSSHPFSLIYSDVWGPSRIKNINGTQWFVLFVDDHIRLTWLFPMKEKSEIGIIFQRFNTMIQTQFQTKIQVLKTDYTKEYFGSIMREYLSKQGIIHQSSCVDTPQQNGVAEHKNRHILEVARSLMFNTNVPKHF